MVVAVVAPAAAHVRPSRVVLSWHNRIATSIRSVYFIARGNKTNERIRWLTDGGRLNYAGLGTLLARLASVETALLQQNIRHRKKVRDQCGRNTIDCLDFVDQSSLYGNCDVMNWGGGWVGAITSSRL